MLFRYSLIICSLFRPLIVFKISSTFPSNDPCHVDSLTAFLPLSSVQQDSVSFSCSTLFKNAQLLWYAFVHVEHINGNFTSFLHPLQTHFADCPTSICVWFFYSNIVNAYAILYRTSVTCKSRKQIIVSMICMRSSRRHV